MELSFIILVTSRYNPKDLKRYLCLFFLLLSMLVLEYLSSANSYVFCILIGSLHTKILFQMNFNCKWMVHC